MLRHNRQSRLAGVARSAALLLAVAVEGCATGSTPGLRVQRASESCRGIELRAPLRVVRGGDSLVFMGDAVVLTTGVGYTAPGNRVPTLRSLTFEVPISPGLKRSEDVFRSLGCIFPNGSVGLPTDEPEVPIMQIDDQRLDGLIDPRIADVIGEYRAYFDLFERTFFLMFHASTLTGIDGGWTCVNCTDYLAVGDPLSKIIKATGGSDDELTFVIGDLDCSPAFTEGGLYCIDPESGTYHIPWSLTQVMRASRSDTPPLVVTVARFHVRNSNLRSLLFRENVVEVTTNVFITDPDESGVRLGRFEAVMTPTLASAESYFRDFSRNLRNENLNFVPHAPLMYIDGRRVHHEHPNFFDARRALLAVVEEAVRTAAWTCVDCVTYTQAVGGSILRIREGVDGAQSQNRFSRTELGCQVLGDGRLECVDPEFGLFQVPW